MKTIMSIMLIFLSMQIACAQNVTIHAKNTHASDVFRELMRQTGKNFVYSSDLLKDVKVTVSAGQNSYSDFTP